MTLPSEERRSESKAGVEENKCRGVRDARAKWKGGGGCDTPGDVTNSVYLRAIHCHRKLPILAQKLPPLPFRRRCLENLGMPEILNDEFAEIVTYVSRIEDFGASVNRT